MERPIGDIFVYKGTILEVVEVTSGCHGCYFKKNSYQVEICLKEATGPCSRPSRTDHKSIIFKNLTNFKFLK